jgi:hypothetical protein
MTETEIALLLCGWLAGAEVEGRQYFDNQDGRRHVRVDCETPTHVIEVGLDGTASSRDSVHQAVFASVLTGKIPMVVLIDRDGVEGRYEQEMRLVTDRLGIPYGVCAEAFVTRWRMTQPFRAAARTGADDLPDGAATAARCDIGDVYLRAQALWGIAPDDDKLRTVTAAPGN